MTPSQPTPNVARYRLRWRRLLRFVAQRLVLRTMLALLTRTTAEGYDNIVGLRPPFVVVANHCSHLDTVVIVSKLPYHAVRHLAVGAAADHFYTKRLNKLATSLSFNAYPIHRDRAGQRPAKGLSRRLLADGVPLLIYPEGTRSRDGSIGDFRPGAAALCVEAGVPCVPVALHGTGVAMPVGRSWPLAGRPAVHMTIGTPMTPTPSDDAEAFNARVAAAVAALYRRPAMQLRFAVVPAIGVRAC
jgi:1-acyl-sn-glycerol-3-phosphate acyltransferase